MGRAMRCGLSLDDDAKARGVIANTGAAASRPLVLRRNIEGRMTMEDMDVTIKVPGHEPIRTSTEGIRRAAEQLQTGKSSAPGRFAKDQLKALVERIERLEEEK